MNVCRAKGVVNGVAVSCDKRDEPKHSRHHDPVWRVDWNDSGPVQSPPRSSVRPKTCAADGCNLWPNHAGPHGQQLAIPGAGE